MKSISFYLNNIIFRNRIFHVIGDSHVSVFSGTEKMSRGFPSASDNLPVFRTYRVGPFLAYNVGREEHPVRKKIEKALEKIPCGGRLVFCFGEIDCRAHLLRQSQSSNTNLEQTIRLCVENYIKGLSAISERGYKIHVWGAPPTKVIEGKEYSEKFNLDYPYYGSYEQRILITRLFNEHLKELCRQRGFPFLSIFDMLIDKKSAPIEEYFIDPTHLSPKAVPLIMDEFTKRGIFYPNHH